MKNTSLYPLVFDAVKDPLILVDRNGVVLLANASAISFFSFGHGHTLSEMECTEPGCVVDSREIRDLMALYDSIRDYALKDKDGRDAGITVDVDPVHLRDGEPPGRLLHFRGHYAGRHRELWRDELVAMVSHEIKNPLSAMKNSVEILLSQLPGELTEGQKKFLNTSERNIDRLTHLVDGFLDVSRINAGAFALNRQVVDVRQFICDVIESFSTLFNVKRVHLEWRVEDGISKGYIDPGKLEQVLINLLSNALKFTPEDGSISVTVKEAGVEKVSDDLRLLPWETLGEPRMLEIVVKDTGLGMSSRTLDNLFNRYHQSGDAGHGRGAHLGLSISKALVEAQDGRLDVTSELGIGTSVSVIVPQSRHTACVMARTKRACHVAEASLRARRPLSFYLLGKLDGEHWEDISGSWLRTPVVNPARDATAGEDFLMWTINQDLAFALLLQREGGAPDPARIFAPQFIKCGEASFMFNNYALGSCHSPDETGEAGGPGTFSQLFNIAARRMNAARETLVRSAANKLSSGIEAMIIDLGS
ncbi:MAG: HAMP domain-containing sensor histidine kinase [Candidatus Latescibacterota bacterium]|jgi:signal transduction histidine kinase